MYFDASASPWIRGVHTVRVPSHAILDLMFGKETCSLLVTNDSAKLRLLASFAVSAPWRDLRLPLIAALLPLLPKLQLIRMLQHIEVFGATRKFHRPVRDSASAFLPILER